MKQNLTHNRHLQICAALMAADLVVFTAVDPRQSSALWLIIGYVLLGLTVFALTSVVASALKAYGRRTHSLGVRAARYAAIAVVALVGLQSIGQLTVKDVATFVPLVAGVYLYISYGGKVRAQEP